MSSHIVCLLYGLWYGSDLWTLLGSLKLWLLLGFGSQPVWWGKLASTKQLDFPVVSVPSYYLPSVTLWCQDITYLQYFILVLLADLPIFSWAALLFQPMVVLSPHRDSGFSFKVFDVQHQSSNLLSHGFTFLHKHQAVKNNILFMFSVKSTTPHMSLLSSCNLALPTVLTVFLVQWKLSMSKDKVCTLSRLSDECRFLTCAPGSLSATLLHLWRPFSLQTIALKPSPLLNSFSFSPLKGFRGLCWNESFNFFRVHQSSSTVHYSTVYLNHLLLHVRQLCQGTSD